MDNDKHPDDHFFEGCPPSKFYSLYMMLCIYRCVVRLLGNHHRAARPGHFVHKPICKYILQVEMTAGPYRVIGRGSLVQWPRIWAILGHCLQLGLASWFTDDKVVFGSSG